MGEAIATLFILITVMSISAVLFSGWVAVLSLKGIGRLFGALMLGGTVLRRRPSAGTTTCPHCRQMNPAYARFCRRCGAPV
jgi:zinc ribbon protein